jgi:hypothetical protein
MEAHGRTSQRVQRQTKVRAQHGGWPTSVCMLMHHLPDEKGWWMVVRNSVGCYTARPKGTHGKGWNQQQTESCGVSAGMLESCGVSLASAPSIPGGLDLLVAL